jgi:hypothetical protein
MDGYKIISEVVKKPIREIVKDPEWQRVRQSLVGQWKIRPEWCIKQVQQYIEPINKTTNDKLRIMMNYLNSSGFRTGRIHNDQNIRKLRSKISIEIKRRKEINKWY